MKKFFAIVIALLLLVCVVGCSNDKGNSDVLPEKIEITGAQANMMVGDKVTVNVRFTPSDVTIKEVTWEVSDNKILKITTGSKITVEALAKGEAYIKVKSTKANIEASFKVVVEEEEDVVLESISFLNPISNLNVGANQQLEISFVPNNATDKSLVWSSNDESVLTVTQTGIVTGISAGQAEVTAVSKANSTIKATVVINVTEEDLPEILATDIDITTQATSFVAGNTFKLTVYPVPTGAGLKCEWTSSDEEVATVDSTGRVTCLKAGSVTITCTDTYTNISKTFDVTIEDRPELTGISVLGRDLKVGENAILKATAIPEFAELGEVRWSSSDESIATIDETGKVTAIAVGEVTITVTEAGGLTATCIVKVESNATGPESVVITTGFEEVVLGYPVKFVAQVLPAGVDQRVEWSSNNEKVGTIDETGLFVPVSPGTTRIRATSKADDSIKSSYFSVKVVEPKVVEIPNLNGYEIIVMNAASALHEHDPFLDAYAGLDKSYKQEAWREIEEAYNCKIIVTAYPDEAPWGPQRVKWINTNAQNKTSQCDFGVLATQWLPQFVNSTFSALVNTSDFFFKYGNNQIEPALLEAASYNGNYYAVSIGLTIRTYPISGLFYNYGLVQKLNLESPAKLFNEGRWTYSGFEEWCKSAQAVLGEGQYVFSGNVALAWQGMVNAAGVRLADTTELKLNIKHDYSYETIETLRHVYEAGCWDEANLTSEDANATTFQSGDAIFQPAQYWFVGSPNRFPETLWGTDNTFYGYVPYPYPDTVDKENTRVNFSGESVWMMIAGKEKPAGVSEENVYQAVQDMFLTTIKKMKADPLIDANSILRSSITKRIDDPESVDATLFFTADKTIFDPYFDDSFQYSYSGETLNAVVHSVQGADPAEEFEAIYSTVELKFLGIFAS